MAVVARSGPAQVLAHGEVTTFLGHPLTLDLQLDTGVLAVDLSRRRRELALRAALGATPTRALRFVAAKGLAIGLPGLALGLLLAAYMAQGISELLFDVSAIAPWVVAASGLPLLLLTALVCWSLARRAARIQPNLALREE